MRVACILLSEQKIHSRLLEFAESCLRFSPQIALREPNVVFIEIGKCKALYSEASFIARARVILRRFSFEGRIAISDDIPSALALAKYDVQFIDQLPIEALDNFGDPFGTDPVGRKSIAKMIDSLKRLGIQTILKFKTVPPSAIPSRFGGIGLYCRQRIEESSNVPWPYWKPPEKFAERIELLPSEYCSDIEPLLFKAKEMLDRLFSRLRGRVLRAERIRFSIELEKYSTVKNPIREWDFELITPQGSTLGFLPVLRERLNWDLCIAPIESYVIAVTCDVLSTTLGQNAQRNFFHSREEYEEAMGSLFGQLEEYLGKGRVFWAKTTEERFPEKSWLRTKQKDSFQADLKNRYPRRPTRIFTSPIPISIIYRAEGNLALQAGVNRIVFRGKIFKSVKWSQVERLSMDWLDDVPARNYYRVELEDGRALWIFSDPGHHYFAHGYFE